MPTNKEPQLNKSEAMRKALAQNPTKTPSEIARMLTQQHGAPFRPNAVSTIKAEMKKKPEMKKKRAKARSHPAAARQAPPAAPQASGSTPARSDGIAHMVSNLQAYITRFGKDDLKRLIDTL